MPILATDQFGPSTLFTMTTADTFAFLKRDVAYVSSGGPAMVIGSTIATGATLTIAGMVEARGEAIAIVGSMTTFVSRFVNVREGGSVAGSTGIRVTNADFLLVNDGTISGQTFAITTNRTTTSNYVNDIVNNGVITGLFGSAILFASGRTDLINNGLISGDVGVATGTFFSLNLVNAGRITGNISGGVSSDTIDTYAGIVTGTLGGGGGSDTYIIAGTERVVEFNAPGTDTVLSHGDYRLPVNVENLTLLGAARTGHGNLSNNFMVANDQGNALFGLGGNDTITGGAGDDTLNGGAGDDVIALSAGFDTILGGQGVDLLSIFLSGDFTVNLAAGTVAGTAIDGARLSGIENVITGNNGNRTIIGSNAANRLEASSGNDVLSGGAGNDILVAGGGDDTFDGGTGSDLLTFGLFSTPVTVDLMVGTAGGGFWGKDIVRNIENVTGSDSADSISGDGGRNVLDGAFDNDVLNGLGGNDVLIGGAGDDVLTGGGASDIFLFATDGFSSGTDTITDFQDGFDRISFVGGDAVIDDIGDLTFTTPGDGSVVIASAEGTIVLQNVALANISAADFIFDAAVLAAPPMPFDRMPQWHDFAIAIA